MPANPTPTGEAYRDLRSAINADAAELSMRLRARQLEDFPPEAQKKLRLFSPAEAARFIGIAEGYLRQLASEGRGPDPLPNGRRLYSIEHIEQLRRFLDGTGKGTGSEQEQCEIVR